MPDFSFRTSHQSGAARLGWFETPHGTVETPTFMPVGTHGAVRTLSMSEVRAAGAGMVLANAYHLYLRPGDMMVRALGGLHAFTRWSGPMLTDSGGFQVFSLAKIRTVSEDGVEFRSHIDGSLHQYTPESVMRVERNLGADVIMQLDELIAAGADIATSRRAMERSLRWLGRCRVEFDRLTREGRGAAPSIEIPEDAPQLATHNRAVDEVAPTQALFPIVQGGTHAELRRASARGILSAGEWHGVAIGGLSVGEAKTAMHATLEVCEPELPRDKPRYLMGVGFPDDLVEGVRRGIDMYDCIAPTRLGHDGTAFTPDGKLQILKSSLRMDRRPLVEGCPCACCTQYDRAYMRHMFSCGEALGMRLLGLHNVTFLCNIMRDARSALRSGNFESWSAEWLRRYNAGSRKVAPPA
ncbi:MAG: tRNA guanosine(34) transglycosylase Tgt [Phycisphaerae bacterium]|nr:tRNA guanosine(34) transglycosylase Tgt [Gemmatimonadaceae bacterium]